MMLPDTIEELIKFNALTLRVSSREGKHCEYKQFFIEADICKYLKSLTAFSNADGGKIIFGVSDSPRNIVGVPDEIIPDDAEIGNHLNKHFDPELNFETKEYKVSGLTIFAIAVPESINKPIMCKKGRNLQYVDGNRTRTKEILAEGAIYYRYAAKSEKIKHSELSQIIRDRDNKRIESIIDTLRLAEKVGFEKVGFVDASKYGQEASSSDMLITPETARSLNFIEEGKFVQKEDDGAPAYYVLGKVNLREVVVGDLPLEDKNLPSDVARILAAEIRDFFWPEVILHSTRVGKILARFSLSEMPYSQFDAKIKRTYVTREGLQKIRDIMNAQPLEFLRCFSSKANIERFEREE